MPASHSLLAYIPTNFFVSTDLRACCSTVGGLLEDLSPHTPPGDREVVLENFLHQRVPRGDDSNWQLTWWSNAEGTVSSIVDPRVNSMAFIVSARLKSASVYHRLAREIRLKSKQIATTISGLIIISDDAR